jgi:hypothetical protein
LGELLLQFPNNYIPKQLPSWESFNSPSTLPLFGRVEVDYLFIPIIIGKKGKIKGICWSTNFTQTLSQYSNWIGKQRYAADALTVVPYVYGWIQI